MNITEAITEARENIVANYSTEPCVVNALLREIDTVSARECLLMSRARFVSDVIGHWMPAMDACDKPTATAIRALRDVCGWKKPSPNHKIEESHENLRRS
jgi:hypothetical protein